MIVERNLLRAFSENVKRSESSKQVGAEKTDNNRMGGHIRSSYIKYSILVSPHMPSHTAISKKTTPMVAAFAFMDDTDRRFYNVK